MMQPATHRGCQLGHAPLQSGSKHLTTAASPQQPLRSAGQRGSSVGWALEQASSDKNTLKVSNFPLCTWMQGMCGPTFPLLEG
eukprot:8824-Amphidinium_carterae.1